MSSSNTWQRRLAAVAAAVLCGTALTAAPAAAEGPEQIVNGTFDSGHTALVGDRQPDPDSGSDGSCAPTSRAAPSTRGTPSSARTTCRWSPGEGYSSAFTAPLRRPGSVRRSSSCRPTRTPSICRRRPELSRHRATATATPSRAGRPAQRAGGVPGRRQRRRRGTICLDNVSLTGGAEPPVYVPDTGPRVRVNQVGYLPNGPKNATLVTDGDHPLPWQLKNAGGTVVASGTSTPARRRRARPGRTSRPIDFSCVRDSRAPATR